MPTDEIETHPYLALGEAIPNATSLILGSFPVYYCTNEYNQIKQDFCAEKSIVRFFYGSNRSKFWNLYQTYIDPSITLPINVNQVLQSLSVKRIALSDTTLSCERVDYSASDNDLRNRELNVCGLTNLFMHGVAKVLCTSKGVLRDLGDKIVCTGDVPIGSYAEAQSLNLQADFLKNIGGDASTLSEPVVSVFDLNNGKKLSAICIPSPGSYQRSIQHFGYSKGDKKAYACRYFEHAFQWLLK